MSCLVQIGTEENWKTLTLSKVKHVVGGPVDTLTEDTDRWRKENLYILTLTEDTDRWRKENLYILTLTEDTDRWRKENMYILTLIEDTDRWRKEKLYILTLTEDTDRWDEDRWTADDCMPRLSLMSFSISLRERSMSDRPVPCTRSMVFIK